MITEANASGTTLRAEIYAGSRHLATWNGGTTYFNHADWLGTERARTFGSGSQAGLVCETITSLPFGDGQATSGSCTPTPTFFTGKERDGESGLDNFGARYFGGGDSLGRFMTPDPLGQGAADPSAPQTWNMYAYARNNPTSLTDRSGEDVYVCFYKEGGGQDCAWYSDKEYNAYATAQNAQQQGIVAPVANDQNLGHPSGNIMCGSSVCGTVTYGEAPSQDTTGSVVNIALGAWSLTRAAVSFVRGLLEGLGEEAEEAGTATVEETAAGRTASQAARPSPPPDLSRLSPKIQSQMIKRGWTPQEIERVYREGIPSEVVDRTAGFTPATQYVDQVTGRFVVVNNATGNVVQISGPGFLPNPPVR